MKEEILLLTGWGSTCGVWKFIIPVLSECYQIKCHAPSWLGESTIDASLKDFDDYIEALAATCEKPVYIVAWSLGGLLAIALAERYPRLIKKICFVSSVPNFVSKNDEYTGINFDWFQSFVEQFQQQPLQTLKKFLALQVKGDEFAKNTLKELRVVCPFENYDLAECAVALELLGKLDLKKELCKLDCETVFIHGMQDAVVNVRSAHHYADISESFIHIVEDAGHAPHVSHAEEVLDVIHQTFKA
jgi:pimeloyl-[acyl-carrier protein] methyl ester esterase